MEQKFKHAHNKGITPLGYEMASAGNLRRETPLSRRYTQYIYVLLLTDRQV